MTEIYQSFLNQIDNATSEPGLLRDFFHKAWRDQEERNDNLEDLNLLRLEHEMFHLGKSASGGFSPKNTDFVKKEDGSEEEVIWPDYHKHKESDYTYYLQRFRTTINPFLKFQYGLICYIGGYLKDNREQIVLVNVLFDYSISFYEELKKSDSNSRNGFWIVFSLRNAFEITVKSKFVDKMLEIQTFLENEFLALSTEMPMYYHFFQLLTDLILENKKAFSESTLKKITSKIFKDTDHHGDNSTASEHLIKGLAIVTRYNLDDKIAWHKKIGDILERSGDNEIERGNYFGYEIFEKAANHFKTAGFTEATRRVKLKYQNALGRIQLDRYTTELSETEKQSIEEYYQRIIKARNPALILNVLTLRPNVGDINVIKSTLDKEPDNFLSAIGLDALNKFGHRVERYETRDQLKEHSFWNQFAMEVTFASGLAHNLTVRAIDEKFINSEIFLDYLKNTWLSTPRVQYAYNKEYTVVPLQSIEPGIRAFFDSFEKYLDESTGSITAFDFMLPIDSLILKVEQILRFMCEDIQVPIIYQVTNENGFSITRFKTLSHLFSSLQEAKVFKEKDEAILKYLVVDPEHSNIRNEIAHGLFDPQEYTPLIGLRIIGVILILSTYRVSIKERN